MRTSCCKSLYCWNPDPKRRYRDAEDLFSDSSWRRRRAKSIQKHDTDDIGGYLCLKCLKPTTLEGGMPLSDASEAIFDELLKDKDYEGLRQAREIFIQTLANFGIAPKTKLTQEEIERLVSPNFHFDRIKISQVGTEKLYEPCEVEKILHLDELCALITAPYYGNPNSLPTSAIIRMLKRVYNPHRSIFKIKWDVLHWLTLVLNLGPEVQINKQFIIRMLISMIFTERQFTHDYTKTCTWKKLRKGKKRFQYINRVFAETEEALLHRLKINPYHEDTIVDVKDLPKPQRFAIFKARADQRKRRKKQLESIINKSRKAIAKSLIKPGREGEKIEYIENTLKESQAVKILQDLTDLTKEGTDDEQK